MNVVSRLVVILHLLTLLLCSLLHQRPCFLPRIILTGLSQVSKLIPVSLFSFHLHFLFVNHRLSPRSFGDLELFLSLSDVFIFPSAIYFIFPRFMLLAQQLAFTGFYIFNRIIVFTHLTLHLTAP